MLSFKEFLRLEQQIEDGLEPISERLSQIRKGALVAIKASSNRRSNAAHRSFKRSLKALRANKHQGTKPSDNALPEALKSILEGLLEMNGQQHQALTVLTLSIQLNERRHRELLELLDKSQLLPR